MFHFFPSVSPWPPSGDSTEKLAFSWGVEGGGVGAGIHTGKEAKETENWNKKETLAGCLPPRPSQSAFLYSKPSRFWSLNDRREEWRVRKRNEKDAWRGSVPFLSPAIFLYIGDLRIPIRPRLNFLFTAKPLQSFLIIHEIIMKREVRVYSTGKVIPRSRRENNAFQFPGKR